MDDDKSEVACQIVDNDDGSYHVKYQVARAGKVNIVVKFKDDKGRFVEVRGSPYSATFVAPYAGAKPGQNTLTGARLQGHLTSEILSM